VPDIHIERSHALGMERARELVRQWVAQAEQDYGLACQYEPGETRDRVQFSGIGVGGTVEVTAESFSVQAHLGFLLGSFSALIEQRVARNLDELLASEAPPAQGLA
jgi:putative polyhydroxyalkanoate system protein